MIEPSEMSVHKLFQVRAKLDCAASFLRRSSEVLAEVVGDEFEYEFADISDPLFRLREDVREELRNRGYDEQLVNLRSHNNE